MSGLVLLGGLAPAAAGLLTGLAMVVAVGDLSP